MWCLLCLVFEVEQTAVYHTAKQVMVGQHRHENECAAKPTQQFPTSLHPHCWALHDGQSLQERIRTNAIGLLTISTLLTYRAAHQEERRFIRRYIRGALGPTWCNMLGKNMFACIEDTSAGVRRPRTSAGSTPAPKVKDAGRGAAAQTWPHPSLERVSSASRRARQPIELGTIDTSVAVPPSPYSDGRNSLAL